MAGQVVGRVMLAALLWCAISGAAFAAGRVALIVANQDYTAAPLQNPITDANLIRPSLEKAGFAVTVVPDADLDEFDAALTQFIADAENADIALFYFAGHGFSVADGIQVQTILMSTDADLESKSPRKLRAGGISLEEVISSVAGAAKVALFFVDACRKDPTSRAGDAGDRIIPVFSDVRATDVFVGLSTRLGTTASDGVPGEGTLFARAFAQHIAEPGIRIDDAFTRVRMAVEAETDEGQSPQIVQDDLDSEIILASLPDEEKRRDAGDCELFVRPEATAEEVLLGDTAAGVAACRVARAKDPNSESIATLLRTAVEQQSFREVWLSRDPSLLDAFFRLYPDSRYAGDLNTRMASLGGDSVVPDAVPPKATESATVAALRGPAAAEGSLNVIALPHDWCGFGEIIDGFKRKYPEITVVELNPDAGSGDELEAVRSTMSGPSNNAPDVLDIGQTFAHEAKVEGLLAPYKVSTWASIPDNMKDADGYWYADYYGVLSFLVDVDAVKRVPSTWAELRAMSFNNAVALGGDPRSANQAIQAVFAAGLAYNGGDMSTAGVDGLAFLSDLYKSGNMVPVRGTATTIADGSTPLVVGWDYNTLAWRDGLAGEPETKVVVPSDSAVGSYYVQAISAFAPHPNAAKLWMEHLYSDAGQLALLRGYCHPARFADLVASNAIPREVTNTLPPHSLYANVVFPDLEQMNSAKQTIVENWDSVVGADIQ